MTIALHGNLGSVADWRNGAFFQGPTETIDLWSEAGSKLGLVEWAEDFCERFRQRGEDEKAWLAGYSLGGRLALHALLAAPELWWGAVIVSAHPGLSDASERRARLIRDREWADRARHSPWVDFLDEWNAQPVFGGDPSPEVRQRQLALEHRREAVARGFETWSLGCQEDLCPWLASCALPVLWVSGAEDEKFTRIAAETAAVMPRGVHCSIANCGHRVLDLASAELTDAIGDFQMRNL